MPGGSKRGVFTKRPETLTNDFFVNLLDMRTQWQPARVLMVIIEGRDRKTNELRWTGSACRPDLWFALAAPRDGGGLWVRTDAPARFVRDFVAAWNKVMNLDRFDLA